MISSLGRVGVHEDNHNHGRSCAQAFGFSAAKGRQFLGFRTENTGRARTKDMAAEQRRAWTIGFRTEIVTRTLGFYQKNTCRACTNTMVAEQRRAGTIGFSTEIVVRTLGFD